MDNRGKWKSFIISDKINIFAQYILAHMLNWHYAWHFQVSLLNITEMNHLETKRSYIQCALFSKQHKWLKHLPLEKLDSALAMWFKQAWESNASVNGSHIKEKSSHIAPHLGIANFLASNGWNRLTSDTLFTELFIKWEQSVDPEIVEDWKNY